MQSFELLGGKYQQGEQILPGVIQTFRSYEVPTGRPVFIHRIPSDNPAAKEVADLLSAGLIRSPAVRKMLLDVYESEPYRFVVTEAARQCVPLRDWLEREADGAAQSAPAPAAAPVSAGPPAPLSTLPVKEAAPLPEPPVEEEVEATEPEPDAEASEFARLFHEALSGKMERSRRSAEKQTGIALQPGGAKPAVEQEPEEPKTAVRPGVRSVSREQQAPQPVEPVATAAALSAPEHDLFQVVEAERAGKSRLIIILVALGVLATLLVIFILVYVTR